MTVGDGIRLAWRRVMQVLGMHISATIPVVPDEVRAELAASRELRARVDAHYRDVLRPAVDQLTRRRVARTQTDARLGLDLDAGAADRPC